MPSGRDYDVLVIGGGHAGAEAAWAASSLGARVGLITMDPAQIGAMSCNPAIGGLAKGQMVCEIDALGGMMGLAADATGIQFRILNATKGPAVRGPRCQSDKYRYARQVQRMLAERTNIEVLAGSVEEFVVQSGRCMGVRVNPPAPRSTDGPGSRQVDEARHASAVRPGERLTARAVVLTTGTFMRGLMHTGQSRTAGGRVGEAAAVGISGALGRLGFELGRLKTGTPPRLDAGTIDLERLELQPGDDPPAPFSDMTDTARFPVIEQRPCWITATCGAAHELIRANLHRAPMYNGQIEPGNIGPRYCPSIEDKVVRFADRSNHHVYLEPESLDTNEIYCNGISTSLPRDVQDYLVHHMPGCERAKVLRYGYAVEYDMVWPHQIDATCMTKRVEGLFLAGQINGTSGYEEAAGQGLVAGLNAARVARGLDPVRLGRDQAYVGVLLDDLVTKTPREPYRMFTSRAECRLLLRADNADQRLTPLGRSLGLVDDARWRAFQRRQAGQKALFDHLTGHKLDGQRLVDWLRRPQVNAHWVLERLNGAALPPLARQRRVVDSLLAQVKYAGYIQRQQRQIDKLAAQESAPIPASLDFGRVEGLRNEARHVLEKFRPQTMGQAGRLAGVNPADLMLISVALKR